MSRFAVNGKEPIAVWCPSRDDSGVGTTTLNDLVGSNHGTLTNFALSGSTSNWVSDTANGGVRALDFDGTNDHVTTSFGWSSSNTITVSMWVNLRATLPTYCGLFLTRTGSINGLLLNGPATNFTFMWNGANFDWAGGPMVTLNSWSHIVAAISANAIVIYKNGVAHTLTSSQSAMTCSGFQIGRDPAMGRYANGRIDDIRVFNSTLNASDATRLFTGGRGGVSNSNGILVGAAF